MADKVDYVKNLINKTEKSKEFSKPLSEWISTSEGKTIINSLPESTLNSLIKRYKESPLSLIKKLSDKEIKIGKEFNFAKGGTPMATQTEKQQMKMMLEGGGLKDEGGTIDPVSGNEVPDGATQEGVRDDVPAMLSEGEYVMNEASTRYHGVDKLNAMQEEAKQGYQQMEKDGLMGEPVDKTEEALPFGMADLNVSDEEGRELMMADGGDVSTQRKLNTIQDTGMPQLRPQPTFGDSMGGAGGFTFKMYVHPDGRNMMVPFMNGIPMFNIPEGFVLSDPNNPLPTPDPAPPIPPAEIKETEAERIKRMQSEGGPDNPDAGQPKSFEDMTPEDRQKARDFYNKDSKLKSVLQSIPFTRFLINQGQKSLQDYDRKTLNFDIQNESKKRDAKAAIALAEKKAAEEKAKKAQEELEAMQKQAEEDRKQREKNEGDPTIGGPDGDVTTDGVTSGVGTGTTGVGLAGEGSDSDFDGGNSGGSTGSGTGDVSAVDMGGPDVGGNFGGGSGNFGGGSGNFGGVSGDSSGAGDFGIFNKGGLAGVKPKKKTKTYKKGGLATR